MLKAVSAAMISVLMTGASAQAASIRLAEIPEAEAERIAPRATDPAYQAYLQSLQEQQKFGKLLSQEHSQADQEDFGIVTVMVASIVLDAIVNIGVDVWKLIEAGKGVFYAPESSASAVPKGITNWTQLAGWQLPKSKLYKSSILKSNGDILEDIYFRLVFQYGGSYNGKGKFLSGVTIMPAEEQVPYLHYVFAKSSVQHIGFVGSAADPVATMDLELDFGQTNMIIPNITEQSIFFHVQGDGTIETTPGADASGVIDTSHGSDGGW